VNSSRTIGAALLLLAVAGCLHPEGTAQRPAITSFDIQGTKGVSASALHDSLATQPSGRWAWEETQFFDEDAFANDKRRIVRFYQAHGFYDAKITDAEVVPDGEGRVKLRIRVAEGPPVRVASIEMPGIEKAPEARERLGRLPLRQGDVFTEVAYDAARAAILNALTTNGWAQAEVNAHAQIDPATHEARVTYAVNAGERYKFGAIFVGGAVAIPRSRVREEAEVAIKPGATFDSSALRKGQARISDLGVFGGVRVTTGTPDDVRKQMPVVVSVREAPFRTIRAGPGFEFQQTKWELDARVGWSHRNWLGGLRKLNLDLKAGYAWLPTILSPTKQGVVGLASADFLQPAIIGHDVDLNLRLELERGLEPAYDFWAQRFRIGTPIRWGRVVTFIPSYNLELYETTGQVAQGDPTTGNVLLLQTCPTVSDVCVLSYLEQRLTLDFRDNPIITTSGVVFSVALQEGFKLFGLGSPYLRLLPEVRGFVPLPEGMVLAARVRIGIAKPLGGAADVPVPAKFMSGGPNFMRGYYSRALSPVICNPADTCKEYIPVGGNGLVDGTIELRFPISGNLGGAVFLDYGNVTIDYADALKLGDLQYAVGFGIRYRTVFGPIRLDIAGRLPKGAIGDQPGVPIVTIPEPGKPFTNATSATGQPLYHSFPIISVHLSIGEAF
jgi:translocation and assembly module TamA